ncbi:MAG TPA: hypothetical protein VFZ66_14700 [Herpetosiphonaceae bacterium]
MQHTNASKTARPPSLIETITQGFEAVNRRLWVVPILFVLDLFYWLGPRISIQPLIDRFIALMRALGGPEAREMLRQQMAEPLSAARVPLNLGQLQLLPTAQTLLPSVTPPPLTSVTWQISSVAMLLAAVTLLNLLALLVTLLYLMPLADIVRGDAMPRPTAGRMAKAFASLLGIVLIVLGILLLFAIPFGLLMSFASLISPALGSLVASLWFAFFVWLLFTAYFSFDAAIFSGVGPIRALLTSLFIVQRSFWGAIGLYLIGRLIMSGMNVIWQMLSTSEVGLVVAMIGSAYLSCGLAAAHLIFYRDRLSRIGRRA